MKRRIALTRPRFRIVAGFALITGLALPYDKAAAASDGLEFFHQCVGQEIPASLRRFVIANGSTSLSPDDANAKAEIVNNVFSVCRQRALDGSHRIDEKSYVKDTVDAIFKQFPAIMELQRHLEEQWKSDPGKAIEEQTVRVYSFCLEGTARRLSRTSDDPVDTIEQGSLAACEKSRRAVFDIHSSRNEPYSSEAMNALEQQFHRNLPEIVTKTRNDVRKATQQ